MTAREAEQTRRTKARLRITQHYQQVTHNVSLTCRFFGISRSKFYFWMTRYRKLGAPGLREYRRGPRNPVRDRLSKWKSNLRGIEG